MSRGSRRAGALPTVQAPGPAGAEACRSYRPAAANPAGALVEAIREQWPAPPAWLDAQEHAAAVARQAEEETRRRADDERRRREWAAKPPEERVQGRLLYWLQKQRLKAGREPSEAEVAAKRAELLAELAAVAETASEGAPSMRTGTRP